MADCALSSSNHLASCVMAVSGENSNSLQSRACFLPSPEVNIFQGEQEPIWFARRSPPSASSPHSSLAMSIKEKTPFVECSATQVAHSPLPQPPENSVSGENPDENHVDTTDQNKTPALNKPSNGVVEDGPVLGGVASPVLSESGETSPIFQDERSSRKPTDGSNSTTQGPANLLPPQNQTAVNATPHSTSNHAMPIQQRFNPRGIHSGNRGGPPHGGFISPSQAPAPALSFPMFRGPHDSYGNQFPPMTNTYLGEHSYQNNNWNPRPFGGYLPQPHPVNNHHGISQRGNFNPNIQGGHGRGRFFNGGNFHMHQQRPHLRSPWRPQTMPPTNFFSPPPVRSYGDHRFNHAHFDSCPPEYYRGQQYEPQPYLQFISSEVVNQINYYFCEDNLARDAFLRSHMDDQGWVSVYLVADFPRVKGMTSDIRFILDSLRASTVVEVQGDKMRRRNEWIKWILNKHPAPTHQMMTPTEPAQDLITKVQHLTVEEVVQDPT